MSSYLTERGRQIYDEIESHCRENLGLKTIDYLELAMLANSFALYEECSKICNEDGVKMSFINDKGGVYEQIRPEYTVMKTEYSNVLKHGSKFGLNPSDFNKLKGLKPEKEEPKGAARFKIA